MASKKKDYINYIDAELTSGRHKGPMVDRLSDVAFPDGFDKENKSMKKNWDGAMKHCMTWCERIDDFNSGSKLKHVFKS